MDNNKKSDLDEYQNNDDQNDQESLTYLPENLPPEIIELIESLPEGEDKEIKKKIKRSLSITRTVRSSPIPSAEELKAYNDVIDGAGDRIIQMAEKQQNHRINMEKLFTEKSFSISENGQKYAYRLSIIVIIAGCILVYFGHTKIGASLMGVTLLALVGKFLSHVIPPFWKKKEIDEENDK